MVRVSDSPWSRGLIGWVDGHMDLCEGMRTLHSHLVKNRELGHYIHAQIAKQLHESGNYRITGVEMKGENAAWGKFDVDIELFDVGRRQKVYVQVWHGQNTFGHIIEDQFTPEGQARTARDQSVSKYGGVKTDWQKDHQVIKKKLAQLPDGLEGYVMVAQTPIDLIPPIMMPEWHDEIPLDKCIIQLKCDLDADTLNMFGTAVIHHGPGFDTRHAEKVIASLGFGHKGDYGPYIAIP